jgi:hypothetical protein
MIMGGTATVIDTVNPEHYPLGGYGPIAALGSIAPLSGILKNLYVRLDIPPGLGAWLTFTVNVNLIDTPLSVILGGVSQDAAHDFYDQISIKAGDRLRMIITPFTGPSAFYGSWGLEFVPIAKIT